MRTGLLALSTMVTVCLASAVGLTGAAWAGNGRSGPRSWDLRQGVTRPWVYQCNRCGYQAGFRSARPGDSLRCPMCGSRMHLRAR